MLLWLLRVDRCQYGVTCRFSEAHTGPDLKNLVKQELYESERRTSTVRNHLDKDLQRRLRKKQVSFTGTDAFLKSLAAAAAKGGKKPQENSGSNEEDVKPQVTMVTLQNFVTSTASFTQGLFKVLEARRRSEYFGYGTGLEIRKVSGSRHRLGAPE